LARQLFDSANGNAFRSDINGLRAWAVCAVLLYHFAVPGIAGGFVGVDIFFVISGFLMAGIVCRGLEAGNFSVFGFYLARARRIWPMLLLVVLAVMVLGWFILLPSEYQTLGKHARDSLFFKSNIRYLSESGYFDVASQQKWLLHTWSLSVEWQFYLIYPLVLLGVHKVLPGRRALLAVHLIAILGSFVACVLLTRKDSEIAFFLLQSRAWELLLGGLVFLLGERARHWGRWARSMEWLGFALIIIALLFIDTTMAWPGYWALVPTLGTCLVLLAARQQSAWTGTAVAQWLGTRSYSIYLWHWPLVVILSYFLVQHSPLWIAAGLLASVLLAHVSHGWVEVRLGRWLAQRGKRVGAGCLIAALVLLSNAAQWIRADGVPGRLPDAVVRIDAQASNHNPRKDDCFNENKPCVYGGDDIRALVIGDSHADALVTAVQATLSDPRQGVYFRASAGCLMVKGAHRMQVGKAGDQCWGFRHDLFAQLDSLYPGKPLIVINRTTGYALGAVGEHGMREGLPQVSFSQPSEVASPAFLAEFRQHYVETVCHMARQHPVFLVRPLPEMPLDVPMAMGHDRLMGKLDEPSISREQYRQRHAFIWSVQNDAAAQCGVRILDPLPYLCDEQKCYGSRDGLPLYVDDNHISELGNRLLVPMFKQVFEASEKAVAAP